MVTHLKKMNNSLSPAAINFIKGLGLENNPPTVPEVWLDDIVQVWAGSHCTCEFVSSVVVAIQDMCILHHFIPSLCSYIFSLFFYDVFSLDLSPGTKCLVL